MKSLRCLRWILVFGLLFAVTGGTASPEDDVAVEVRISPTSIGMDEQAILEVTVNGAGQNMPQLEMPSLPSFEVYSQGRSSSVSIVNGVVSSTITQRFQLVPHKPGSYRIDSIAVIHNGRRYAGNVVTLMVVPSGQSTSPQLEQQAVTPTGDTRDYFLEASVDKSKPYVNEQVTLTLRFFIAVQYYSSPELEEPSTTGFWTEVLGNSSPYFKRLNGRNYRVIERKYALFPTQSGELTIGRAAITTTVAGRRSAKRDPYDIFGDLFPQGEKVTTSSTPIALKVRAIPDQGKPEDFTGSIGRYAMSARIDRSEVEVNQPVTMTLSIQGVGNIKTVAEPSIEETPDFRVYRASSNESMSKNNDLVGGTKTFEEVFLPKRPGMLEIPPISLSFFDPNKGKFETVTTRGFTVTVKKPEGYAAAPDIPYARPGMTLGADAQDIRYIQMELGELHRVDELILFTPLYVLANGLPVVLLIGLVLVRKRRDHLAANVSVTRSRGASRMARRRLAKARSLAKLDSSQEFYGEMSLALMSYIADKLDTSPHGLTSDQIGRQLLERSGNEALSTEAMQFLRKCDFARFAPATLTADDLHNDLHAAEQLMDRIEGVRFA